MPKIEMKPTAAETLNGVPVRIRPEDSAQAGDRNLRHDDEGVDQRSGRGVEHARDQHQRERHHDHQAAIGRLQFAVLARPFQMHALGQLDLARDCASWRRSTALCRSRPRTANRTGT